MPVSSVDQLVAVPDSDWHFKSRHPSSKAGGAQNNVTLHCLGRVVAYQTCTVDRDVRVTNVHVHSLDHRTFFEHKTRSYKHSIRPEIHIYNTLCPSLSRVGEHTFLKVVAKPYLALIPS